MSCAAQFFFQSTARRLSCNRHDIRVASAHASPGLYPNDGVISPSIRTMCVLLVTVLCLPGAVTAQSSGAATDIVLGAGRGHGGDFGERGLPAVGIAITLGTSAGHSTTIGVSADFMGAPRGDKCFIDSAGQCIGPYPNTTSVGVELRRHASAKRHLNAELFGVLGMSWYDQPPMRALMVGVGARLVGRVTSRVAIVMSVRALVSPNTSVGTLWVAPLSVGVRLH